MSSYIVFDLETDGLLPAVSKVHCAAAIDNTGKIFRAVGHEQVKSLMEQVVWHYDLAVGHNIVGYDHKVCQKLDLPYQPEAARIRDTLVMSRLIWPDIKFRDIAHRKKHPEFPGQMIGRHSLEAWGHRLGEHKGDFGKTTDWSTYSDKMLEYCVQDVKTNVVLWKKIMEKDFSATSIELEHEFAVVIEDMTDRGVNFNVKEAQSLYVTLAADRQLKLEELESIFPARVVHYETPKKKIKRTKEIPFNPGSRPQIAWNFKRKYGWEPTKFTPAGEPALDEDVLSTLPFDEAKKFLAHLKLTKRLGQLAEGSQAWLKKHKNGRLHGRVTHNGTVTGRCTHSGVANVPRPSSYLGQEFRALFLPDDAESLVGADASQLELRCLAHYMSPWDGGAYAREILEGDIHTVNMQAAGLSNRDDAKTFIYAFLYGAGDEKIGSIVGGGKREGKAIKNQFMNGLPALRSLRDAVVEEATIGWEKVTRKGRTFDQRIMGTVAGIDGRRVRVRSEHSALNTKLQSAGGIVMKKATVLAVRDCGFAAMILHMHDEYQFTCPPQLASEAGDILVRSIRQAGEDLGFNCPLDGEYKIGNNWTETH